MTKPLFQNRQSAGLALAKRLKQYAGHKNVTVLAIPRGGVPVGYEISKELDVPLDVFIVRKLGIPGHEELALGAVASGGGVKLNNSIIESHNISRHTIAKALRKEEAELKRRENLYRRNLPPLHLKNKVILLVDDGIATGASIKAAYKAILQFEPAKVIVAAPVASSETCAEIEQEFGQRVCVCAITPEPFFGVGRWYQDFHQMEDSEVIELLEKRRSVLNHGVSVQKIVNR